MQLIDSHTHIDFSDFNSDRNTSIQRALDVGVSDIIVSSTTADRWCFVKKVCDANPQNCHPAYGLHPMFMNQHKLGADDNDVNRLKLWLQNNAVIAIGEIGLDFYIKEANSANREAQLRLFISQLEIAADLGLPVIIHARKSLDIVLKHLRKFPAVRGSIHSFSGSEQQAKQLIDLGFYLGFGGPITYDRATRLQKLLSQLPLEAMLIETDAPDQPDSSHYGQRNEPAFIHHIAGKIAEIKQIDINLVAKTTTQNAIELFRLNPT